MFETTRRRKETPFHPSCDAIVGPTGVPLVVWLGFELGIAPVLGLSQAKRARPVDPLTLAAGHTRYGLVLSATRFGTRS